MVLIEEVLTELGWDDGFHVPVANEENKRLEEEIDGKARYKTALNLELEAARERIDSIKKHAAALSLEHERNQKLLTARSMQLDSEDHLFRLCDGADSKLARELRDSEKERIRVARRVEGKEKEVFRTAQRLNDLKKAAEFDKDQLSRWEEALRRGDEDNRLVESYMKTDGKKFKELELRRQNLQAEVEECRRNVVAVVNSVFEMENVLDRTARLYGGALKERQRLINQWTQSVMVLKQRDNEIHRALREIDELREIGREKTEVLREAEKFLENQITRNREVEEYVEQLERKLVTTKDERLRLSQTLDACTTELHVCKKMLVDAAQRTQNTRAKRKRARTEVENGGRKIEERKAQVEELEETYRDIDGRRTNIAERTKQLENMIEKEEKLRVLIDKEINRLRGLNVRTESRINELEGDIKILELRIENERKKMDLSETFRTKGQKNLEEKIESLYRHDFEIQKAQIRLRRLAGVGQDKAVVEKKERIVEELEKSLSDKTDLSRLLRSQINTLEHDMKKLTGCIGNDQAQLRLLRNKKQDQTLLMEGGEKQLGVVKLRNEETQVNENVLRLRISQAEQTVSNIDNKVYNLEKYKLQVQAAMRGRRAEIKAEKGALSMRKRVAANESAEIRAAIGERKCRVQQLQTRYDNLVSCSGTTADGTPLTTTYIKIKSAQEKYALREQGDRLDETIRRTEREIQSMENTLRIVNASNDKYKKSLGLVEESGPEQIQQTKLNEETYNELERVRDRRDRLERARADSKITEDNYGQLSEDIEKAEEERARKRRSLQSLERQIAEQREKQLRADNSLRKVYNNIQNMGVCDEENLILVQEKDIAARELREQNGLALQHLTEFVVRHVEAEPYVKKLLSDKGMALPCTSYLKPSPASSRCQSGASSVSAKMATKTSERGFSDARGPTTAESVGSVFNVEANFEDPSSRGTSNDERRSERTTDRRWKKLKKPTTRCGGSSSSNDKTSSATKRK